MAQNRRDPSFYWIFGRHGPCCLSDQPDRGSSGKMRKQQVGAKPVPRAAAPPSHTADRASTASRSRLRPPRLLTYVDAVARYGSIRKAADGLNIASSALNRQILDLEADLGAPLFERLPRGVRMTSAGEGFLVYCRLGISERKLAESPIAH